MKKTIIALAVSAVALSAGAQASDNLFYVGGKVGFAQQHDDVKTFREAGEFKKYDRKSAAAGVYFGVNLTKHFAFEGGYEYIGKFKGKNDAGDRAKMSFHAPYIAAKLTLPVTKSFDVYGKVGAAFVKAQYEIKKFGGTFYSSPSELKPSALFAVGTEYAFTPSLALRTEVQWLNNIGYGRDIEREFPSAVRGKLFETDVASVSVGLTYSFGSKAKPAPQIQKFTLSAETLFDTNKSTVKAQGIKALDSLYGEINKQALNTKSIEVAGYADARGSDKYNQKLSQKRAESVANYLVGLGLSKDVVNAVGYGEANPVTAPGACKTASNKSACYAPDRRVEVSVDASK